MIDPRPRIAGELGLEPDQADGLVWTLLAATRTDLEGLRRALAAGQSEAVAGLAHHVKGAAANLEIEELRAPAARLEALGREGQLSELGPELLVLERAVQELEEALAGAGLP